MSDQSPFARPSVSKGFPLSRDEADELDRVLERLGDAHPPGMPPADGYNGAAPEPEREPERGQQREH